MQSHSALVASRSSLRRGFTLVELLIVIGIIGVLAAILFPVVRKVREAAFESNSRAAITAIEGACQSYFQDFKAFPGPLSALQIAGDAGNSGKQYPINGATNAGTLAGKVINDGTISGASNGVAVVVGPRITGNENAVLGLLGGLVVNRTLNRLEFDPDAVGKGANGLNPLRPNNTPPYFQNNAVQMTRAGETHFVDFNGLPAADQSKDTIIPDFVDKFPSPMPLLILRARVGGKAMNGPTVGSTNNDVVINSPYDASKPETISAQYNLVEITPYTQSSIGTNPDIGVARGLLPKDYRGAVFMAETAHGLRTVNTAQDLDAKTNYPYDAFSYLADPASYDRTQPASATVGSKRARKADTIIIISPGKDRVYGTNDDLTNFGGVLP